MVRKGPSTVDLRVHSSGSGRRNVYYRSGNFRSYFVDRNSVHTTAGAAAAVDTLNKSICVLELTAFTESASKVSVGTALASCQ